MDDHVLANVDASVGVAFFVGDELAIKVLVVATKQNVSWLDDVHYSLDVETSDVEWLGVIGQNGQKAKGKNLQLPKLCQEL